MKLLGLRVAIKPEKEQEDKTASGIILSTKKKKTPVGEVIAVGNSTTEEEMVISVGDKVVYGKISSTIEKDGEDIYILDQQNILAIL